MADNRPGRSPEAGNRDREQRLYVQSVRGRADRYEELPDGIARRRPHRVSRQRRGRSR